MMTSSGMNLVMTVIGFAVSTLFIVFVCTRLICARIQLRAARRSFRMPARSNLSTLERGLHGLEVPVLANFPAKRYSDEYFSSLENAQCSVCLAEYRKEDILRILPHCGHYFHINCVDMWLLQNSTCPVCRVSLRETNEKKRSLQPLFSSRSHHGMESANIHTYRCLLTPLGLPSSSQVDRGTSLNQGNQSVCRNDSQEVGESINPLGGNCASKDPGNNQSVSRDDSEEVGESINPLGGDCASKGPANNHSVSRDALEEVGVLIMPLGGDCASEDPANTHVETPSCA